MLSLREFFHPKLPLCDKKTGKISIFSYSFIDSQLFSPFERESTKIKSYIIANPYILNVYVILANIPVKKYFSGKCGYKYLIFRTNIEVWFHYWTENKFSIKKASILKFWMISWLRRAIKIYLKYCEYWSKGKELKAEKYH